jgi:hypothetical protein
MAALVNGKSSTASSYTDISATAAHEDTLLLLKAVPALQYHAVRVHVGQQR